MCNKIDIRRQNQIRCRPIKKRKGRKTKNERKNHITLNQTEIACVIVHWRMTTNPNKRLIRVLVIRWVIKWWMVAKLRKRNRSKSERQQQQQNQLNKKQVSIFARSSPPCCRSCCHHSIVRKCVYEMIFSLFTKHRTQFCSFVFHWMTLHKMLLLWAWHSAEIEEERKYWKMPQRMLQMNDAMRCDTM